MSSDHFACLSTGSTLSPISLTPRLSNSPLSFASAPSSVVQTGVKSFGCENKSAQPSPIHSWNLILPSVVSASKSGAIAPMGRAIFLPHVLQVADEFTSQYSRAGSARECNRQKKNILLPPRSQLGSSFGVRRQGEKTTTLPN